ANGEARKQALNMASYGVLVLANNGQVLFMNREAMRIVEQGGALQVTKGSLHAVRTSDDAPLQRLIGGATAHSPCGSGTEMPLTRPGSLRPYMLLVSPLPEAAPGFGLR